MGKEQAFSFLDSLQGRGIKLGVGRIQKFLEFIGNPEKAFNSVIVAGTNGKGSTAAMIESILRRAGYKTGMYTSPHLVSFNERIKVNGKNISDARLVSLIEEARAEMEKSGMELTYFEFITAFALKHFAEEVVDFAVLEVGMGGRLDATNIVTPKVSVITNVEREHERHLGNTQEKIAFEKAGVIKKGIPVVTAEWKPSVLKVFRERCKKLGSELVVVKKPFEGKLALKGRFQKWNAALAAAAAAELEKQGFKIGAKAIAKGLADAEWPGRFQILRKKPALVLDCAHNPACCVVLAKAFQEQFPEKKALLVIGISDDKKAGRMAKKLAPIAKKVFATAAEYRAMPPKRVASHFKNLGIDAEVIPKVEDAFKKALSEAGESDIVLVTGSCFVVGEAMKGLKGLFSSQYTSDFVASLD